MGAKRIFSLIYPDQEVRSVHHVDYEQLAEMGKEGIIFDLDNTLGPWRSDQFDQEILDLFSRLQGLGFKVGILSNGSGKSIRPLLEEMSYPVIFHASKPRRSGFRKMLSDLDVRPEEAVMVGDQLLTDVLGANRANIYSILVKPVVPGRESIFTKLNRYGEGVIFGFRSFYHLLRSIYHSLTRSG